MNQGIIGSIFSTSIIFSSILFYFVYKEILTIRHLVGITFMCGSVAMISLGGESSSSSQNVQTKYLTLAVILALLTGVTLSVNAIIMRHYITKVKFSALQLNNDGGLIQMSVLMVLFVMYVREHGMYATMDLIEAVGGSFLSTLAAVSLSKALSIGLGGPVQAIANLMSVV